MDLLLRFDGACWPNPGPAAYAVVVESPAGEVLHTFAVDIGYATNNLAEWHGCLAALREARRRGAKRPVVVGDSRLVIEQASGRWKCKKAHLRPLVDQCRDMIRDFDEVTFRWESRETNELADGLAGLAISEGPSLEAELSESLTLLS